MPQAHLGNPSIGSPRRSLEHLARAAADLETLAILLLSDANNSEEELVALAILKIALSKDKDAQCSSRYGSGGSYSWKKCKEFFDLLLHSFPVCWFKAWLRMGRDAFWHLHDLIAADAAFQSTANRPQRPVHYQLATFLCRVGAEMALKTASVMAVAEGSVYNYVQHVIGAIRHLRSNYLAWPGEARRHFISEKFAEQGFPGCLGTTDGSDS
ncbi:hypothetical protein C8J55DRAFT_492271 [Lentinula edodes]|uniref:Uncharacterized protein n=1 Tax=Lentinula lateritia TaxID=40482 RepID=A0A9W8ZWV7_9AGAR|nr:hypothetical protein C8J55DRAFT_492271 [Lentinula edodes]